MTELVSQPASSRKSIAFLALIVLLAFLVWLLAVWLLWASPRAGVQQQSVIVQGCCCGQRSARSGLVLPGAPTHGTQAGPATAQMIDSDSTAPAQFQRGAAWQPAPIVQALPAPSHPAHPVAFMANDWASLPNVGAVAAYPVPAASVAPGTSVAPPVIPVAEPPVLIVFALGLLAVFGFYLLLLIEGRASRQAASREVSP